MAARRSGRPGAAQRLTEPDEQDRVGLCDAWLHTPVDLPARLLWSEAKRLPSSGSVKEASAVLPTLPMLPRYA